MNLGAKLCGAALLATATGAAALPPRLPPTDTCTSAPGFVAFRNRLRHVIARRDAAALLRIASPEVHYLVTGRYMGRVALARFWGLEDRPASSRIWQELDAALRLGCAHSDQGFYWAPSFSETGDEDMAGYDITPMVAVGPAAFLRARPSDRSRAIARLRWDVVGPTADDGRSAYLPVRLQDGRHGFVRRDQLRSTGDYSAMFQVQHGRWQLVAFTSDVHDAECDCDDVPPTPPPHRLRASVRRP